MKIITDCQILTAQSVSPFAKLYDTEHKRPVLPISNERVFHLLKKIASNNGGEIIICDQKRALTNPSKDAGEVIGVTHQLQEETSLYAHLTNRTFRMVDSVDEIKPSDRLKVIIALTKDITPSNLHRIYRLDLPIFPGIITGETKEGLYLHLISSASSLFASMPCQKRIDIFPASKTPFYKENDYTFIGGEAEGKFIKQSLKIRPGLLNIYAHSDGVDSNLGNLFLCALKDDSKVNNLGKIPNCVSRKYCGRLNISLEEALKSERLVSPDVLKAHVLLYITCYGFLTSTSLYNFSSSYTSRILSSGNVGAMVTTFGLPLSRSAEIRWLTKQLSVGEGTLGERLNTLRTRAFFKENRINYCLLGDPDLGLNKVCQPDKEVISALIDGTQKRISVGTDKDSFMKLFLKLLKWYWTEDDKKNEVTDVISQLDSCVQGAEEPLLGARICNLIRSFGTAPRHLWMKASLHPKVIASNQKCFHCGSTMVSYHVKFNCRDNQLREFDSCPNCGIIDDRPARAKQLELKLIDKKVVLHEADGMSKYSYAELFIEEHAGSVSSVEWPKRKDGSLVSKLVLKKELKPGINVLALCCIYNNTFRIVRIPFRVNGP